MSWFFGWTFSTVWGFVMSSATISTLIGIAAVVVAVVLPPWLVRFVPGLRTIAIYTAIAAFSYTFIAGKFYNDGIQVKQSEWDEAIAVEAARGDKAGADAAATVDPVTSDRSMLSDDPWNRDVRGEQPAKRNKGPLRWLGRN